MHFLRAIFLTSPLLLLACSQESVVTSEATSAELARAASATQIVPFLTKEEAISRARLFDGRHPQWKTTEIDRLTGAIAYSSDEHVPEVGPAVPDAELIRRARAWLLADADIHGIQPSDLGEVDTDAPVDTVACGVHVSFHRRVTFWAARPRAGYEAFPALNGRFAITVEVRQDGAPFSVRAGLDVGDVSDDRHLPSSLALTIGTAPRLSPSDPRAVADVLGRSLRVYRSAQHDLLPIGVVEATDATSLAPFLAIKAEAAGVRLTMAYRVVVTKPYVDAAHPSVERTASFEFIVDGATGAVIDDGSFCYSSVQAAAWCEYKAAFADEGDGFPRIDPIAVE